MVATTLVPGSDTRARFAGPCPWPCPWPTAAASGFRGSEVASVLAASPGVVSAGGAARSVTCSRIMAAMAERLENAMARRNERCSGGSRQPVEHGRGPNDAPGADSLADVTHPGPYWLPLSPAFCGHLTRTPPPPPLRHGIRPACGKGALRMEQPSQAMPQHAACPERLSPCAPTGRHDSVFRHTSASVALRCRVRGSKRRWQRKGKGRRPARTPASSAGCRGGVPLGGAGAVLAAGPGARGGACDHDASRPKVRVCFVGPAPARPLPTLVS